MKDQIHRASLLRIAGLVKPAVATSDYVAAYTHIRIADGRALAHNDIAAIEVECQAPVNRCVPGDLLIRALGSFAGEQVGFAVDAKTEAVVLKSGRASVKLPTLPADAFPFAMPVEEGHQVQLTAEMLRGIERCLLSVSSTARAPAGAGVTMEVGPLGAVMYATDDMSISRYECRESPISLPGGAPIVMPTFFCEQLIRLAKEFPQCRDAMYLVLLDGALLAEFWHDENADASVRLFHKYLVDIEPLDFGRVMQRVMPATAVSFAVTIPDGLDAAMQRAVLVQAGETEKTTHVTLTATAIRLQSSSQTGDSDDTIDVVAPGPDGMKFAIDPELVARGLKSCDRMALLQRAVAFLGAGDAYTYLVTHLGT